MAIYHCSIRIINRSGGRSAVASAAYRAGEKLTNHETGLIHDFTKKGGVVMREILLPENAPEEYRDRETLWNEVQKIEKRSDAQMAREVEVALPMEMDRKQQIECVRDYIQKNFVSRGMIADWALHDKEDGNPHAHILLTMRGLGEDHSWEKKQKTVFANARDDQGRAIYNPELPAYDSHNKEETAQYRIPVLDKDGNQKIRIRKGKGTEYLWEKISIPANDWNDRKKAEEWRESWAEHCNRYLEPEDRIDHRSFKRQGKDLEPTIHEGVTARKMELDGKTSDRCSINREIRERNSVREQMRLLAKQLSDWIVEKSRGIYDRFREFGRSSKNPGQAGRHDGDFGRSTARDREAGNGETGIERTVGRILEFKRTVDRSEQEETETDRQIVRTDTNIAATDQRIEELNELAREEEAKMDERLQKIRERRVSQICERAAESDRETAGGKQEVSFTESRDRIRETANDIRTFLAALDAKESSEGERREDYRAKEADRGVGGRTERVRADFTEERPNSEGERKSDLAEKRSAEKSAGYEKRYKSRGRSR